jgi:hypothetical protein
MEPLRFVGWTDAARAVIERACESHGGERRWRQLELGLELRTLSGLIPRMKGAGKTFPVPGRVLVRPSVGAAIFQDYPTPGTQGHFDGGAIWLEDPAGRRHTGAANHRTSFTGWNKWRRWEALDALYFFGYAVTHYHALPFTLPEGRLVRHRARADGDTLTIDLPAALHTHSRRQTFHFDPEGLIRRHDYVADIVGWWARGAHFWRDHVRVDGYPVARTRHVVARLGSLVTPVTALHAELAVVGTEPGG